MKRMAQTITVKVKLLPTAKQACYKPKSLYQAVK